MDTKQILIDVSAKYAELVVLVRKLIETKVSDVEAISQLQSDLNLKNQEVSNLLSANAETAAIAGGLSSDIAALIVEASAAIPGEAVEPIEEVEETEEVDEDLDEEV